MSPLWSSITGLLLAVITVTGNGLVIYLIAVRRNLRTCGNYFLLSLAVADFSCGLAHPLNSAVCYFDQSNAGCIIVLSVQHYLFYSSITNLCALTLDRYIAIAKPLRYITFMTIRRFRILATTAWMLPLLVFVPPFLASRFEAFGQRQSVFKKSFLAFLSFFQVCVCLALLLATTRIFLVARRHARQNAVMVKQLMFNHRLQHGRAFRPQEAASAKVVGSVVGIFVLCYAVNIYSNLCVVGLCKAPGSIYVINTLLKLVNSTVNPIAYAFFKKDIKRELRRLLFRFRGHQ